MKVLLLDIETAPLTCYSWGLYKQNINPDNVIEQGYTLCWAANWLGQKEVLFSSLPKEGRKEMILGIHSLLDEADAVIHYNGTKFDIPTLNHEFLFEGLDPPSPYFEIDLLKTARQRFRLPSNKLDYVARPLGLQGKVKHMGLKLWHDCMEGCPKAWRVMERYNKQDVNLLEDVYNRFLPWVKQHPNWGHYVSGEVVCAKCGSGRVKKNGIERSTIVPYQRYKCTDCGSPLKGRCKVDGNQPSTRPG